MTSTTTTTDIVSNIGVLCYVTLMWSQITTIIKNLAAKMGKHGNPHVGLLAPRFTMLLVILFSAFVFILLHSPHALHLSPRSYTTRQYANLNLPRGQLGQIHVSLTTATNTKEKTR